jgi:hypothetical protein
LLIISRSYRAGPLLLCSKCKNEFLSDGGELRSVINKSTLAPISDALEDCLLPAHVMIDHIFPFLQIQILHKFRQINWNWYSSLKNIISKRNFEVFNSLKVRKWEDGYDHGDESASFSCTIDAMSALPLDTKSSVEPITFLTRRDMMPEIKNLLSSDLDTQTINIIMLLLGSVAITSKEFVYYKISSYETQWVKDIDSVWYVTGEDHVFKIAIKINEYQNCY